MTSGLMYIRAVYRLLPRQLTDLAVRSRVLPQLFALSDIAAMIALRKPESLE